MRFLKVDLGTSLRLLGPVSGPVPGPGSGLDPGPDPEPGPDPGLDPGPDPGNNGQTSVKRPYEPINLIYILN